MTIDTPKFATNNAPSTIEEATNVRPTFPSSAMATATKITKIGSPKYPWSTMDVGTSFHVATGEATYATIRNSCSKMGKKFKRKFRAIDHGNDGIEVARLPDVDFFETKE